MSSCTWPWALAYYMPAARTTHDEATRLGSHWPLWTAFSSRAGPGQTVSMAGNLSFFSSTVLPPGDRAVARGHASSVPGLRRCGTSSNATTGLRAVMLGKHWIRGQLLGLVGKSTFSITKFHLPVSCWTRLTSSIPYN